MRHVLKTWPEYYQPIIDGEKTFEVRKNDRNFRVGDEILLEEYEPESSVYTGRSTLVGVTYMLKGCFGIYHDHCVMSIQLLMQEDGGS